MVRVKKCIHANVERYDATVNVPTPNGRFVRHSDFRRLQVELRKTKRLCMVMLADMEPAQREKYIGSRNE